MFIAQGGYLLFTIPGPRKSLEEEVSLRDADSQQEQNFILWQSFNQLQTASAKRIFSERDLLVLFTKLSFLMAKYSLLHLPITIDRFFHLTLLTFELRTSYEIL